MSERPMDERLRARARLALRAERAMGVRSVRGKASDVTAKAPETAPAEARRQAAEPPPPVAMTSPAPDAQASRPPQQTPALALFGTTADAPKSSDEPFAGETMPTPQKIAALKLLDETQVKGCPKCRLCETRTHTVFGEGSPDARLMFIGEGPGENEDLSGRPFVGKAGQLLEKMIGAMGLRREDVYICNVVKCRPPNNRQPAADETAACTPYLLEQVSIIRPQVIVTLGLPSTQYILRTKNSMSKLRGHWHSWRGIDVLPTYHPAYVLRQYTPQTREAVWSDLKLVLGRLNLPVPKRSGSS
ncbi:MAG TPA: uracil-DNA glycosylase family protein [Tepidisphaeraceae bacterium]|jgi:DNA polymerase